MVTGFYAILHMLVDGICAYSMFGKWIPTESGYAAVLVYNFCAFALQMPLGAGLDVLRRKQGLHTHRWGNFAATAGIVLTVTGMFGGPWMLGVGNALFHVGAGVEAIEEDLSCNWKGRGLGVFVAPGAMGLFLGTQLAQSSAGQRCEGWHWIAMLLVGGLFLGIGAMMRGWRLHRDENCAKTPDISEILVAAGCFLAVILRSYVGMAVTFPWKTSALMGMLAVTAIVLGKMAGGFLSAHIGQKRAVICSLVLATACFLGGNLVLFGLLALFFFNMTMPVTLYMLIQKMRRNPGFAFGLLTFGLFLGFLPVYFGVGIPYKGTVVGALGSLVTLLILLMAVSLCGTGGAVKHEREAGILDEKCRRENANERIHHGFEKNRWTQNHHTVCRKHYN